MIQIRLRGKYEMLRAFASTAEEAARRHDVALSKLEAFSDYNAKPNFPDDFASIDLSPSANKSEDYQHFWDGLQARFTGLCKELEAVGLDPNDIAKERKEKARLHEENIATSRATRLSATRLKLLKVQTSARLLNLSPASLSRFNAGLTQALSALE